MKKGLLLFCVVWIVTGVLTFVSLEGTGDFDSIGSITKESNGERIAKICIGSIFPTVSRGAEYEQRRQLAKEESNQEQSTAENKDVEEVDITPVKTVVDTQTPESPKAAKANIDYSKPVVIIYHTHATESYQPAAEGNFHSLAEENTVREVGNVLTAELEAKGIQVIHDKTINDSPSYNQSYSRSLETIQGLLGSNPTTQIVIDLHRDAAGYSGNVGKTVTIQGKTIAKYNLVIGQGNENVNNLTVFANQVNAKAEELYPGFGGRIIEKEYKFNQWVSDYHMLLEVGNNENTIQEAKLTGKYFADVLVEVIKEIE